ncbi:YaaC family protein [Capillimicrobium parvum]|uniref:Uncharacterized protein n=1 Tax=Capillimicrobium parvum TaxID=2884022 RepID=A0A9E7BZE1_9ACTN|nr:YaaC family protein [Capillimicrobium parvum]UGS35250.1 hypothetical protein DSM104329_01636 [Capillimicrobium parvum]
MDGLRELALLESRDYLEIRFQQRHQRELSASKARSIIAHLIQGRDYWASAQGASDLIRPLLQYYGALAFARAAILFQGREQNEEALTGGHGLKAIQWRQELSQGPRALLDLRIRVTGGTMQQIANATGNHEPSRIYTAPFPSWNLHRRVGTPSIEGAEVRIRDLLNRLPATIKMYERVTGLRAAAYPGFAFEVGERRPGMPGPEVIVFEGLAGLPTPDELRSALQLSEDQEIHERQNHQWGQGGPARTYYMSRDDDISERCLATGADGSAWVITPMPDGTVWSQLLMMLALSFCLGALVRYHPTLWMDLAGQARGDIALPLVRHAQEAIDQQIPHLMAQHFKLRAGVPIEVPI